MFFKQGKPGLKCNVHNLAKYKILMHKHDYKYSRRTRQEEATQIHLSTSLSQIKGWVWVMNLPVFRMAVQVNCDTSAPAQEWRARPIQRLRPG